MLALQADVGQLRQAAYRERVIERIAGLLRAKVLRKS